MTEEEMDKFRKDTKLMTDATFDGIILVLTNVYKKMLDIAPDNYDIELSLLDKINDLQYQFLDHARHLLSVLIPQKSGDPYDKEAYALSWKLLDRDKRIMSLIEDHKTVEEAYRHWDVKETVHEVYSREVEE